MFELLAIVIFIWLMVKAAGLVLRLTWGLAKFLAGAVIVLALPVLVLCLVFAGGVALLVPLGMVAVTAGLVKACL